ncbi:hypothetical protein Tco_0527598 [Tanacetum coccineum]
MGDENSIRTLGDYSKPSHEGYRNTIELPAGNNVVPLRSDTIRLVQNGCSFHGLQSEDPNQHLKDFLKLVDLLNLDGENRERMRLFPHHGLDLWLQIQIFYDHVDGTTQKGIDYAASRRLRKLRPDEAWAAIKRLAQYEDEGWNDAFIPDEDAISLMGKIESIFRLTTNEMYRPPSEPSRQEEFEHIVMNFIFNQEERVRQLEDYMRVITEEFMEFSSKVARRLKERIKENENKPRKIEKITKYPDTKVLENSAKYDFLENLKKKMFPTPTNRLCIRYVTIIPLSPSRPRKSTFGFKPEKRANQSHHDPSNSLTVQPPTQSYPTFVDYDPIKRDPSPYCSFTHIESNRIGGEQREMSLLEFGWRVGLYTEQQSRDRATLSELRNTKVNSIRDPKIRLAYRCTATTISGRKESTHRVTEMDLYYLYWIYTNEVICNIPYWLAKYLKNVGDKNMIYGGMFITRTAWLFGVLTSEMMNVLSVEPPPHVFKKKSLIAMRVIIDLHNRGCYWPATWEAVVEEEDEGDDEGNEAAGGNEMGQGLAERPMIMGASHDLRGDSWGCVPRSLFWREDLDGDGERGLDCLTFTLVLSKAHRKGCRASREDLIRASKGRPSHRKGGYDVKVILPKKSQTILDAPLGYVGLYTHYFFLSKLRLPIPPFICEVLDYFKVHISRFNPFGMVKLTTFAVRGSANVPKVIPDAAMKLVYSNDLGVLIAKLVRSSIIYGRCQAFKEVAAMKEPFILEKMSGYRPLSKEEYDQDGDALANASYPFLHEYVVNPYASLTQLLSKKPPSL